MFFLGLDCSTQSLSAVVIDYKKRKPIYETSVIFEKALPQYKTTSGTLRTGDPLVVHSPPLMWVEALDLLFHTMSSDGLDLAQILAVSGSAQQHGSVYCNDSLPQVLAQLDASRNLPCQLREVFSRKTSPVWMDASTFIECEEIRQAMGGMLSMIEATGSDALERFTGPQIRKFYKTEPDLYHKTTSIALISSFLASILTGKIAPIDFGDGAGMNLMDIRGKCWHPGALEATAPRLSEKLPLLTPSSRVLGVVSPYFSEKYGLNPNALSLPWTGDNPASLIGLGLIDEGIVGISAGTSFTYFGAMRECHVDRAGEGNLFISPTGEYMPLSCFLNGALAIQRVRTMYGLDWPAFNQALETTPPGNQEGLMLPYFEAEITPKVLHPKVRRRHLSEEDIASNCRALIEAQMMSMRLHSRWMKFAPKLIYATGGVSNNPPILKIMADVHRCPVMRSAVPKSTALGAALTAAFGYFSSQSMPLDWMELVAGFTDPIFSSRVDPDPASRAIYDRLTEQYAQFESEL
ncbi:MAG TPA: FGGY family carbohydrate kinase [Chlamydiales bacterium]|nr:FGGY family carbohydrate kinase [Chlamydiales bacterium]